MARANVPSRRSLILLAAAALLAASLIVVCVVLPVEFHIDPTGFGRISGLSRLTMTSVPARNAPLALPDSIATFRAVPYRTDTVDLLVPGAGYEGHALEYKVKMSAGDTIVYSWTVENLSTPNDFYYDFRGHAPGPPPREVRYKADLDSSGNGTLTAPFSGTHGWHFQNQSSFPVVVHLKLSGFYEWTSAQ